MTKQFFIFTTFSILLFTSCNETAKDKNTVAITTTVTDTTNGNIIYHTFTDSAGSKLALTFDNNKGIVTIQFMGEEAVLNIQRAASGIWYKNDVYNLRGKGNDIELKKDGKTIFEHHDDIVSIKSKNDKGDVLDLTFNNTQGTVKAYLNGGEQIDLVEQKTASGIWYKNGHYELSGKGKKYKLLKDGEVVFKN